MITLASVTEVLLVIRHKRFSLLLSENLSFGEGFSVDRFCESIHLNVSETVR